MPDGGLVVFKPALTIEKQTSIFCYRAKRPEFLPGTSDQMMAWENYGVSRLNCREFVLHDGYTD